MNKIIRKLIVVMALVLLTLLFVFSRYYKTSKLNTNNSMPAERPILLLEKLKDSKNLEGFNISVDSSTDYFIFNYWASWCPPCVEETPSLVRFTKSFPYKVQMFAISQDSSAEDIQNFLKTFPVLRSESIQIVWDNGLTLARVMNIEKLPETFIYNRKTNQIYQVSGATQWEDPNLKKQLADFFKWPL